MITQIKALNQANQEVGVRATEGGVLVTVSQQVLWTAKGYGKQAMSTAAVAALVVRPTTTALVTLYNNESAGGKHLFIERAFVHELVSAAAASFAGIWLCVHPVGMTAPGDDITVRNSTSGQAAGGSLSQFGIDETVVDNGWFPWGESREIEATGVLPGTQISAEIGGRIIIPPTAGLSMHVVASSVGEDFTGGFHWFEVPESELTVI